MEIPQSNLRNMLKAISNGNHVFNEKIRLYKTIKTPCPTCTYDPVRKESTDPYCQTCDGIGMVVTESFSEISSSIETIDDFKYDFTKLGKIVKGEIYMTIDILEINTILNIGSNKYDLNDYHQLKTFCESFAYVTWKGAKYNLKDFEPGWLQGTLYEVGFTLALMVE